MRTADAYPSKYITAEELENDLTLTIKNVVMETLKDKTGKEQEKPVAYFQGEEKGIVLNKTNWASIVKQHGDESDDWTGKQITIFAMDVEAFGEMVSSIRIRPARKGGATSRLAAVPADDLPGDEDVTLFWIVAKKAGFERKEALEMLTTQFNGDYKAAAAGIGSM